MRATDEDEFLHLTGQARVAYVRTEMEATDKANLQRARRTINVIRLLHERLVEAVETCDYRSDQGRM